MGSNITDYQKLVIIHIFSFFHHILLPFPDFGIEELTSLALNNIENSMGVPLYSIRVVLKILIFVF